MASKRSKQKSKTPPDGPVESEIRPGRRSEPPPVAETASGRAVALAWAGFILVLLACLAWVITHAVLVDTVTVRLCNQADAQIAPEKRMPVFLNGIAFDGYMWNHHAEHLGENGRWRLRYTDFDNAPDGREVHWSSGFAWYLRGLGEIYRAYSGDSLRNSIFRASIWANPILLCLALGIFATLSARRFGPLCGAVIAIGMVAVPTFYEGFMPAYPDHHGLVAFTIMGTLFGIAWAGAGWVQSPGGTDFAPPHSLRQARHGMIFSAICAAASLWISGFSIVVVVLGIGIATIVSTAVYSGKAALKDACRFHPELWKLWGIATALVSLGFYALEYFPNHMSMRLEVNHPLYALAFLGGGWGICEITAWLSHSGRSIKTFPWFKMVLCSLACLVLPAFILIGGDRYYLALEPFMKQMSANIAETLPLFKRIQMGGLTWQMAFGWFPVFVLAAMLLQFSRKVGRGTKAVLLFLSIPIFLVTALQFYQTRWGMLAGPLYIALAGIVVPQVWRLVTHNTVSRIAAAGVLLALTWVFVAPTFRNTFTNDWAQFRSGDKISLTSAQALALLHRQMARAILDNADGTPVVLLSSPNSSCLLSAMAGFKAVGTLYWENVEGLKAAAAGLNAQNEEEALAFMKKHGVTHVSLMSWENFIEPFFRILYTKPAPGLSFANSFGKRALFDRVVPGWSRPLIFPPNYLTNGLQQQVLMLQIMPDQSLTEAKFHLARFVRSVEGNSVQAEIAFKEILDVAPESSLVRVELANLYAEQRRFDEAVDQTLKALPTDNPAVCQDLTGQLAVKLITAAKWSDLARLLRGAVGLPNATPTTLQNAAWFLSTMPDASARDPKLALSLCDRLEKLPHEPAAFLLVRASALAASGDFPKAISLTNDVASASSANEEQKRKASLMRAAFESGQPWTENR